MRTIPGALNGGAQMAPADAGAGLGSLNGGERSGAAPGSAALPAQVEAAAGAAVGLGACGTDRETTGGGVNGGNRETKVRTVDVAATIAAAVDSEEVAAAAAAGNCEVGTDGQKDKGLNATEVYTSSSSSSSSEYRGW